MRSVSLAILLTFVAVAHASAQDKPAPKPESKPALTGAALDKAMADFKQKTRECTAAREKHEAVAIPPCTSTKTAVCPRASRARVRRRLLAPSGWRVKRATRSDRRPSAVRVGVP